MQLFVEKEQNSLKYGRVGTDSGVGFRNKIEITEKKYSRKFQITLGVCQLTVEEVISVVYYVVSEGYFKILTIFVWCCAFVKGICVFVTVWNQKGMFLSHGRTEHQGKSSINWNPFSKNC